MKIPRYLPSSNTPADPYAKDLDRSLDKIFAILFEILNNGISFDDNFDAFKSEITTDATPGTETAIAHGLKRIPVGMLVLEKDKPAHIYKGPTDKDETNFYIASDVALVKATILIF